MNCEICGTEYPSKFHFDVEWICTSCFEDLATEKKAEITSTRKSLREEREKDFEKAQERDPKILVGCGLIVVALIFSLAVFISSLVLQSVFFTIEDYLQEPMWTSYVPAVVNVPSVLVSIVGGLGGGIAPWVAGSLGLFFLITGLYPRLVPRIAALALIIPLVALLLHIPLLAIGYVLVRGGLPPNSGGALAMSVASLGVPALLSLLLWWKIRNEWPWRDKPGPSGDAA